MNDGTTPLILAARLAVEGTVEDLINAEAEVNATDEYGKTALHWAASVNNVEATHVLLQHGANRDAQDHKVIFHFTVHLYFSVLGLLFRKGIL